MQCTIIVPVYNNAVKGKFFLNEILHTFSKERRTIEFILVDDGSSDKSWELLNEVKAANKEFLIKLIRLDGNFGQLAATTCGIDFASNDIIVTLDDDGKYVPAEVQKIYRYFMDNDYIIVFGVDQKVKRNLMANIFYFILKNIFFKRFKNVDFSSFRIFSKSKLYNGLNKSWMRGNIHTLWLLDVIDVGNFPCIFTGCQGRSRHSFFSLLYHQKHLVAWIALHIAVAGILLLSITAIIGYHYFSSTSIAIITIMFLMMVLIVLFTTRQLMNKVSYKIKAIA